MVKQDQGAKSINDLAPFSRPLPTVAGRQ